MVKKGAGCDSCHGHCRRGTISWDLVQFLEEMGLEPRVVGEKNLEQWGGRRL